jgi:hypothetical protein
LLLIALCNGRERCYFLRFISETIKTLVTLLKITHLRSAQQKINTEGLIRAYSLTLRVYLLVFCFQLISFSAAAAAAASTV